MVWAFTAKVIHDAERYQPAPIEPVDTDSNEVAMRILMNSRYGKDGDLPGVDVHVHYQESFDQLIIEPLAVEPVLVTFTVWAHSTAHKLNHGDN